MPQPSSNNVNERRLPEMLDDTLRQYELPHPVAGRFIRTAAGNTHRCQRHIMLCARSIATVGASPPPIQDSVFQTVLQKLEETLENEPCWPRIRPAIDGHWQDFKRPPEDCLTVARAIIGTFSPPQGQHTAGCRPPECANAMQAEALDGILKTNNHVTAALAGSFVQYSLTSGDYRPRYRDSLHGRLTRSIEAMTLLDQNCAFTLHDPAQWQDAELHPQALAKLMLWSNKANLITGSGPPAGNVARDIALVMAKRRLYTVVAPLLDTTNPASDEQHRKASKAAAYWLEVAKNILPPYRYCQANRPNDLPPSLLANSDQ